MWCLSLSLLSTFTIWPNIYLNLSNNVASTWYDEAMQSSLVYPSQHQKMHCYSSHIIIIQINDYGIAARSSNWFLCSTPQEYQVQIFSSTMKSVLATTSTNSQQASSILADGDWKVTIKLLMDVATIFNHHAKLPLIPNCSVPHFHKLQPDACAYRRARPAVNCAN